MEYAVEFCYNSIWIWLQSREVMFYLGASKFE